MLGDEHVVLDPHADAAIGFGHSLVVRQIEPRLHGQHHAGFQLAPVAVVLVGADVVHVHAQPVAGAVHVIGLVRLVLDQILGLAVQDTQFHQSLGQHLDRRFVRFVPVSSRTRTLDSSPLRLQHQVVDGPLGRTEATIDRKGAGDVRGIAVQLTAGVDQHQIAVAQWGGVLDIVQHTGVLAAGDDARIGQMPSTGQRALVLKLGLQPCLVQTRAAQTHQLAVRAR